MCQGGKSDTGKFHSSYIGMNVCGSTYENGCVVDGTCATAAVLFTLLPDTRSTIPTPINIRIVVIFFSREISVLNVLFNSSLRSNLNQYCIASQLLYYTEWFNH